MVLDYEHFSMFSFNPVYSDDQHNNMNIVFDFHSVYRVLNPNLVFHVEDYMDLDYINNWVTRIEDISHEFNRDWLIGGDRDQIQAIVHQILEILDVPFHRSIVDGFTQGILDLKQREAMLLLETDVFVPRFPGVDVNDADVNLAVAPASDEAVENHFETVVVGNDEGVCVICMDTIRVESGVAAARMPCSHVFHRNCGEEWLRSSGICPVCRAVFPPL
ncbi:unnamed protein product [Thlaspi arvense]|uniref:RING-type E3 ubiquitin transferase n=1 Tax=Thlaspi arvense TaxID=13288 RepID=A0AAU9SQZ1_THLAR|nr:unnamed protein product [Thlaspi arvense]